MISLKISYHYRRDQDLRDEESSPESFLDAEVRGFEYAYSGSNYQVTESLLSAGFNGIPESNIRPDNSASFQSSDCH